MTPSTRQYAGTATGTFAGPNPDGTVPAGAAATRAARLILMSEPGNGMAASAVHAPGSLVVPGSAAARADHSPLIPSASTTLPAPAILENFMAPPSGPVHRSGQNYRLLSSRLPVYERLRKPGQCQLGARAGPRDQYCYADSTG